jgi:hypothetical protein
VAFARRLHRYAATPVTGLRHRPLARVLALCSLLALTCVPAASARSPTPLDLALRFQPHLFFDRADPWRPIDVDAFLAEAGHEACVSAPDDAPPACTPLTSLAQLAPPVDELDLRGVQADGSDTSAPDLQTCAKSEPALLDCDEDGRSVIYAHVTRRPTRIAIDYWWFLRYNDLLLDQHEGDWEGMTVIVDAAARHVVSTHFAAHAGIWRYGDAVSRLDRGRHVRVYVARGSHAAYPRPCRRTPCGQTESVLPEGRSDGADPWIANDPTVCHRRCVRLLPQDGGGAPASWDAWDGIWGTNPMSFVTSPRTPAFQRRYKQPFRASRSARRSFSGG